MVLKERKNSLKLVSLLLGFIMIFAISLSIPVITNAYSQTAAVTVATTAQITATGAGFIDAPLSSWNSGGTQYWIHSDYWGINHQKMSGTKDNPLQTPIFNKNRSQFFTNNGSINGNPWIVSIYKDTYGGLLAFVHMEAVVVGGVASKGRVGLAYSTNNGDTFTYLGEIIAPYNDPGDAVNQFNIQGCPYLVKDGYIYCYYNEYGTNVARDELSDVIAAARNNTVTTWHKYYNGTWTESGMFGNRSAIVSADSGVPVPGICHTQAAYSTYDGKYYLTMTSMNWGGVDTYVRLYQSSDCVSWTLYQVVVNEPAGNYPANSGWQYSSIVDFGSGENATVGKLFYLYCGNRPTEPNYMTWKRWTIDLSRDPVGSWSLNSNVNDSANMNTGSLVNGATYAAGKSGNCVSLDGVNDYVNIPNTANLTGMGQMTLSCWVNMSQLPAQNYVVVGKDSSDASYRIVINSSGQGHFVVATSGSSWYSAGTYASFTSSLSLNTWYHIVGTYDGNYVRVYINGALAGTGSQPLQGTIAAGTSPLRIGYKSASTIDYYKGKVDEVQVYNVALSSTEVDNLYDLYNMTATAHTASSEFTSTQGANNWYYYDWSPGSLTAMTWNSGNWLGTEAYCLVMSNAQHPGANADSARAWWASAAGRIEIKGNARMYASGVDGVIVSIQKNGDVIWTTNLAYN
ncbi:MAG: LamG domain-containing protein, partial [Saccharofermentanales bacterium]